MKKILYALLAALAGAAILVTLLLRTGETDPLDIKKVNWRDFNCATDAGKPYISLLQKVDSSYMVNVLVPYCSGNMAFTSAALDSATNTYSVLFTASAGSDTTRRILERNISGIPRRTEIVKVMVQQDTTRESTIVITVDADEESDGYPTDEAPAMHYDPQTFTVSGFVYGVSSYDPVPSSWVAKKANVTLKTKPPVSKVTFVRMPMHEQPVPLDNYQVLLKFASGSRGRSFSFKPAMNNN